MLDAETKRKIDNCRDILVGKIPDPKSQVEQITIALIYKFMDDMDQLSVDQGGKPSFFRGDFEKYSWSSIFNPRIDGYALLNLYGEALSRMDHNPNIPQLFRDIFKNVLLPYRDPETLRLFLKEIRGFTYDHSERLGDAFEYLLSVLGSQGKAGQFRTPRHIIDFIVKVVDPQLNQTVLDPACGTAGFLISAYKHILKNNPKLSTSQKKRLINNFIGYDIDPGMRRLSLANMYLHGFPEPHIHEYDTLTSEDHWQDTFDVIMANPPFMSPKGGIRPHHTRFSIQAKRSEVLFVDYIAEHLNPSGRAGVIVPEGIIFQSQNAYKALRKMLVENFLWAVVSLPAGVFNPYSGVKTSILLMDKSLAKRIDKILFVKIENDGFDLGAQRRSIDKNDLPAALKFLQIYKSKIGNLSNLKSEIRNLQSNISPFALAVPKSQIAQSPDYNLSGDRYKPTRVPINQKWPMVDLGDLVDIRTGKKDVNESNPEGKYPFFTCANEHTYSDSFSFDTEALLIAGNGDVGAVKYYKGKFEAYQRTYVLSQFEKVEPRYLYHLLNLRLKDTVSKQKLGNTMPYIKLGMLSTFQIPLPPLEVQETIVAEIDGYQKIIDAARQITQSYKPTIKINPDWPMILLGKLIDFVSGLTLSIPECQNESGTPIISMNSIDEGGVISHDGIRTIRLPAKKTINFCQKGDLLFNWRNGSKHLVGKTGYFDFDGEYVFASFLLGIRVKPEHLISRFLWYLLNNYRKEGRYLQFMRQSVNGLFNREELKILEISLPPLSAQKEIVAQIETEQKIINENKKLIEIFQTKISAAISALWA